MPTASPTPTPTLTSTPRPTATPTQSPTATPTPSPTPEVTQKPEALQKTKNSLQFISFDTATNSLQLRLANPLNYQLTRNSPESYSLLLEGAHTLDDVSVLEQFPPQGILGFQAVLPKAVEKGILIEIFLEEDYQPEASWNKNILSVKAKSNAN